MDEIRLMRGWVDESVGCWEGGLMGGWVDGRG